MVISKYHQYVRGHKYTIVQMMRVSVHKTRKTFRDYIKLFSDELKIIEVL